MDPPFRWSCTNGVLDLQKDIFIEGLPRESVITCGYGYQEYTIDSPDVINVLDLSRQIFPNNFAEKEFWNVLSLSLEEGPERISKNFNSSPLRMPLWMIESKEGAKLMLSSLLDMVKRNGAIINCSTYKLEFVACFYGSDPISLPTINFQNFREVVLWLAFRRYKTLKTKPFLTIYLALEEECPITILETIDHFL